VPPRDQRLLTGAAALGRPHVPGVRAQRDGYDEAPMPKKNSHSIGHSLGIQTNACRGNTAAGRHAILSTPTG
jgi:hypothetical protein